MLTSSTKKKIDTARDILVGKIPMPTSQVEQITLALTYKFMSDMDKAARELGDTSGFFANGYEKYAWDKLMDKSLPARDRVKLYGEGLEKMALNPHIPQLFRDIFRNAFLPFNDPETLKLFLDTIDQFEYEHSEELGNAFEYLLQVMGSQGDAGQFRTPRHIIDFIVEVVDPKKTDKILDPACGTAGFLISAYKWLKINGLKNDEMETVSDNFVGYDISQDMQRLSLVNMYLHQFPDPHIYEYDTLTSEERWEDYFDVILANPPFMTPKGGIRPHNRFAVPSNRAEVLFVDYIMEHLTVNGKAGVIVPEGIIFQSQNAYTKLRKMMVDDDYLWAVVSLPSGVFQPYSGVKTSILLFDRSLAKKTNKVLFIRANNDGYDLGAQRRPIKQDDLPQALEILKEYKQGLIEGKELELEDSDMAHVVEKKMIREGGYNLSGEGYKKQRLVSEKYKLVKIGDVCSVVSGNGFPKEYQGGTEGIPFIKVSDMNTSGNEMYILSANNYISEEIRNKINVKVHPAGTIVFPKIGAAIATNKKRILIKPTAFDNNVMGLVPDRTKLLPQYLYFLLQTFDLSNWASESAPPSMRASTVREELIPHPPLSIQQEIVEELDRYQKIIDGARQVVDNYQPSFKIEDDWERKELGGIVNINNGYVLTEFEENGDLACIKVGDMNLPANSIEITTSSHWICDPGSRKLLPPRSVVFPKRGAAIATNKKRFTRIPCLIDNNCMGLSVNSSDELLPEFLFYFLLMFDLSSISNSAGIALINNSDISKVKIPIPSTEEQRRIVAKLDKEREMIISSEQMAKLFDKKMKSRIEEIWGQN